MDAASDEGTAEVGASIRALHADRRNSGAWSLLPSYLGLPVCLWAVSQTSSKPLLSLWILLIGVLQYRLVISCHEAVHKTLLFPSWLNETVGWINGALVLLNMPRYRLQHMAHHRASTIRDDSDAYIYAPFLRSRPGLPRLASWLLGVFPEMIEKLRAKGLPGGEDSETRLSALAHGVLCAAIQGSLAVFLWRAFGWGGYPLLWLLPLAAVALFLNRTRVIIEHGYPHVRDGAAAGPDIDRLPQRTVDIASNPLERWVIAPFAFNYHYAHHAAPSVPHYHNRELSELLRSRPSEGATLLRRSYAGILLEILFFSR